MTPADSSSPGGSAHASVPDKTDLPALAWMRRAKAEDELLLEVSCQVRRRRRRRFALAAGFSAALVVAGFISQMGKTKSPPVATSSLTMAISQPQRQTLPDGSIVELKEGARISSDYSGTLRRVTLLRGEAHFQVAKNKERPFVVTASDIEVRAVGTAFAVQLGEKRVEVLVTEGRVAISPDVEKEGNGTRHSPPPGQAAPLPPVPTYLDAGNLCVVEADAMGPRVQSLSETELTERLAWRIPQLEFSYTPLSKVVELINQYNRAQFVIADPGLGDVRLSGFLRADNIEGLVHLLESNFGLKAERLGETITLYKAR